MAFEEKRAWIMLVTSIVAYAIYATVTVGRLGENAASEVPYRTLMLASIGGAIVASIVLHIVASIFSPRGADKKDVRDQEINRMGEYIGQSFLVIGGVAALLLAMVEVDYFWIANVIYLCFVLSAVLGSVAKIFAYRRGFQTW